MSKAILKGAAITAAALTFTLAAAPAGFAGEAPLSTIVPTSAAASETQGTIVDAVMDAPELSTLTAALTAAELVETLNGDGPFTVFAPVNTAFETLPEGTVASLLEPENEAALTRILTSHVVAGNMTSADILEAVEANGGTLTVETLSGAPLKIMTDEDTLKIKDANGNKSVVEIADFEKSNGTVHLISGVLLPANPSS